MALAQHHQSADVGDLGDAFEVNTGADGVAGL